MGISTRIVIKGRPIDGRTSTGSVQSQKASKLITSSPEGVLQSSASTRNTSNRLRMLKIGNGVDSISVEQACMTSPIREMFDGIQKVNGQVVLSAQENGHSLDTMQRRS
jgi:hypothetical protein